MAGKEIYIPCPECAGNGTTLYEKDFDIFHQSYMYEKSECKNCAGTGLITPEEISKRTKIPALDEAGKFEDWNKND